MMTTMEPGVLRVLRPLSDREREVIAFVARGDSNAEIAAHMMLSVHTVNQYVRRAFAKMGAHSRAQAVSIWMAEQYAADIERVVERKLSERQTG